MIQPKFKSSGINLIKENKFLFCGEPVNIFIPLPIRTCSNWYNSCNERDNIGIIYYGEPITCHQLRHIVTSFENIESRDIHKWFSAGKIIFRTHTINRKDINDIKNILYAVEKNKPRDRYGDKKEYPCDTQLII